MNESVMNGPSSPGKPSRSLRERWVALEIRLVPSERQRLFLLTVVLGGACGLAAVAFHQAIQLAEHLAIDRAMAGAGWSWVGWTLLTPTLGGLLAGALLQYVVPSARGSGIPQVKTAYARDGNVPLRDAAGKFLLGTLQIGTGSSLGREGPTVQICAGIASTLGRVVRVSRRNLKRLLPVGAAAGIAAAFNAPIAAVTFTIEEIVGRLDQTVLSGVIVAAALAAVVERSVLGEHPIFDVPGRLGLYDARSLGTYALLGVLAFAVAVAFTETLLRTRSWFRRQKCLPPWARPGAGGLVTGALAVAALLAFRTQGVTGGGYATLGAALTARVALPALLALCALKLVATAASYGSGGAGGIFAPSLFMGAMLGGATGHLDVWLFHHPHDSIGAFALVGMGAVFAGVLRAPMTSVLIIIEMTRGYDLILPLMLANTIAYVLARWLRPTSVYEALLEQDGIVLERPDQRYPGARSLVADMPLRDTPLITFERTTPAADILRLTAAPSRQEVYPVVDAQGRISGLVTTEDLLDLIATPDAHALVTAADLERPAVLLRGTDSLPAALEQMSAHGLRELPVVDSIGRIVGFAEEATVARTLLQGGLEAVSLR